jgi:SAM-dependent methyltransferase
MEDYRNLHIGCAPGTHQALVDAVSKHIGDRNGVLDIGAHSGALLLRLQDQGFCELTAVDLDETRFSIEDADFIKIDLNEDFAHKFDRKFSLITATDVIEHLDSPRHFIKECRKLLKPGGLLALSFPNIAFWEGRLKFLLRGELWGFGEKNYRKQRHISPMTWEQSRLMCAELGFEVLEQFSAGSFATSLRTVLLAPLWFPLQLIGGQSSQGECTILIGRKSNIDESLLVPDHYKNRWEGKSDRIGLDV